MNYNKQFLFTLSYIHYSLLHLFYGCRQMHTQYLPDQDKQNVTLPCLTKVKQQLRNAKIQITFKQGYILCLEDSSSDIFLHL